MSNNTFSPGPTPNTVRAADGRVHTVPEGWIMLSPGDAALTRRVSRPSCPAVTSLNHQTERISSGRRPIA